MNYQLTELDFGRIFDGLAPDFAGFLGLHDSAIEVNVHGSLGEGFDCITFSGRRSLRRKADTLVAVYQ